MRILIDIGHPAHVHLFKNFAWQMQKKGHKILFTARDKEYESYLLRKYIFSYVSFGKHYKYRIGKIWGLFKFNLLLLQNAIRFKPSLFLSHGSMYAAHVSWILRKPHISFEDTGNMEQVLLYKPFTESILTPDVLKKDLGEKQIMYTGYHELCYLMPKYFQPNHSITKTLGLESGEKYCLLRFVSWNATHDSNKSGLSFKSKAELVNILSKSMKVFISSESALPEAFRSYQIRIPPDRMDDVMAYTEIFIGEGATMASECAVLGIPSIYVNSSKVCNCEDQEKYGLTYNFRDSAGVIEKVLEILKQNNVREEWQKRRQKMLADKIDVTSFLVWFVENYPKSVKIMKENPDYQLRFK